MSEELKPCPFCKKPAKVKRSIGEYYIGGVDCNHGLVDNYPTAEAAAEAWNARPVEDALRSELEAARVDVAEYQESNTRLRDAIRLAIQQRDEARAAVRWIPVSERLPEQDKLVLLTSKSYGMVTGYLDDVRRGDNIFVVFHSTDGVYISRNVTHWMPLPELPRVQE